MLKVNENARESSKSTRDLAMLAVKRERERVCTLTNFVGARSELLTCKNVSKPAMFIIYLEEGWGLLRYFQDPFLEGLGKIFRVIRNLKGGGASKTFVEANFCMSCVPYFLDLLLLA